MSARIITIFSNKGGVGKTFIALNTATSLALAGHKVLLVDLDLQSSQDMARMMNLAPQKSVVDVLPELTQSEESYFNRQKHVTAHASGLEFIPLVTNVRQAGHVTPDSVRLFLKKVSAQYDYVLIDSGRSFNEILIAGLDMSNLILLVGTPDVLAVYQIKWSLEVLQSQHYPLKMIRMLLNRSESYGGVAWQEVKAALGVDILSRIPSDGKTVGVALNRGVPCVIDSPRSKVAQAFNDLALALEDQTIYTDTSDVIKIREHEDVKKKDNFWEKFGIFEGATRPQVKYKAKQDDDEIVKLKKRIHERLVDKMNLRSINPDALADPEQMAAIRKSAERLITDLMAEESGAIVSSREERAVLIKDIVDEALGLGPLEELLADPAVTDIMVNCRDEIYVEKYGKLILTDRKFMSDQHVRLVIERIIAPLGRRIDESVPMVDARVPDGSRVNAIIPPLSLRGPMVTIRKFAQERYTIDDLLHKFKSLSPPMAEFIEAAVHTRKNIIVSGGTGSGKTTLLNIISHYIPDGERIITLEDAAELKIDKSHWARLESRPANVEGKGAITIRDLFVNTLRMRPDRIIIGECRGGEVLDMLQAMNTGHDGSLTTVHANTTRDAITRLNSLILLSGITLPLRATYEMIASAIDIIIQVNRFSDGSRRVTEIMEITGEIQDQLPEAKGIFVFNRKGIDEDGRILGEYAATGYVPACYEDFKRRGIQMDESVFSKDNVYPGF